MVVAVDILRVIALVATPFVALLLLRWMAENPTFVAPIHRRLWAHPHYVVPGLFYRIFLAGTLALNVAWISRAVRNFVVITLARIVGRPTKSASDLEKQSLPPWPYSRESFTLVLGELQDRDGSRVPNERSPGARPRWLTLPELALYTGVFVTGGIGSGKTSAVAYPALRQLLGFRRFVKVRRADGEVAGEEWKFSGLVLDEKGDFTRAAAGFCEEWGRADDLIRITPGGRWIWNVIYNPNLPTWAVGYQLGWIIRNFNKGSTSHDPFWEHVPRELVTEYLGLLDDAEGYYNLFKAVCRSKRASMWELTQSHGSIKGAFGPQRAADANTYFQNSMTHIYLRQSDPESMEVIQKECGKKLVQRTSLAITEGGTSSGEKQKAHDELTRRDGNPFADLADPDLLQT